MDTHQLYCKVKGVPHQNSSQKTLEKITHWVFILENFGGNCLHCIFIFKVLIKMASPKKSQKATSLIDQPNCLCGSDFVFPVLRICENFTNIFVLLEVTSPLEQCLHLQCSMSTSTVINSEIILQMAILHV